MMYNAAAGFGISYVRVAISFTIENSHFCHRAAHPLPQLLQNPWHFFPMDLSGVSYVTSKVPNDAGREFHKASSPSLYINTIVQLEVSTLNASQPLTNGICCSDTCIVDLMADSWIIIGSRA